MSIFDVKFRQMGYTGDLAKIFVESIKPYNKLCREGKDSDFSKEAEAMIPIDEAPFCSCKGRTEGIMRPSMVTISGIITNDKLRPSDKKGQPIKGHFAAGNILGGRYGLDYCTPFAGNSIGMAVTHGWLANSPQRSGEELFKTSRIIRIS